jgi:hypothetical protein
LLYLIAGIRERVKKISTLALNPPSQRVTNGGRVAEKEQQ